MKEVSDKEFFLGMVEGTLDTILDKIDEISYCDIDEADIKVAELVLFIKRARADIEEARAYEFSKRIGQDD